MLAPSSQRSIRIWVLHAFRGQNRKSQCASADRSFPLTPTCGSRGEGWHREDAQGAGEGQRGPGAGLGRVCAHRDADGHSRLVEQRAPPQKVARRDEHHRALDLRKETFGVLNEVDVQRLEQIAITRHVFVPIEKQTGKTRARRVPALVLDVEGPPPRTGLHVRPNSRRRTKLGHRHHADSHLLAGLVVKGCARLPELRVSNLHRCRSGTLFGKRTTRAECALSVRSRVGIPTVQPSATVQPSGRVVFAIPRWDGLFSRALSG